MRALLPEKESYYLVETVAPAGYNLLTEPLAVTIDLTGHNTWTKVPAAVTSGASTAAASGSASGNSTTSASGSSTTSSGSASGSSMAAVPETSQTKWDPYVLSDWLQKATIRVTEPSGGDSFSAIRVLPAGTHEITYDHENDTTDVSVTYQIINNAGIELPHTGGPGTRGFTVLGCLLISLAGLLFAAKQRVGVNR